jgi:hypothetical protein
LPCSATACELRDSYRPAAAGPVAGRLGGLGDGLLPRPRDEERIRRAASERREFLLGQHVPRQRIGIFPAWDPGTIAGLLDVYADWHPGSYGDGYLVTGMADRELELAALGRRLAVRFPALRAGPIEDDILRPPALAAGDGGFGERTAYEEPLPVLLAAICLPAPLFDIVEERDEAGRGVTAARLPHLRRGPSHPASLASVAAHLAPVPAQPSASGNRPAHGGRPNQFGDLRTTHAPRRRPPWGPVWHASPYDA